MVEELGIAKMMRSDESRLEAVGNVADVFDTRLVCWRCPFVPFTNASALALPLTRKNSLCTCSCVVNLIVTDK